MSEQAVSERSKRAVELHKKGYNCAQAVVCAIIEDTDLDEQTAFRMAEAFGFGMGIMHTCGAVSGMAMAVGLKLSDGNLDHPKTKKISYKMMKSMSEEFMNKVGSTICHEIKGVNTGEVMRSCQGCIIDAVEIAEKYLELESKED